MTEEKPKILIRTEYTLERHESFVHKNKSLGISSV